MLLENHLNVVWRGLMSGWKCSCDLESLKMWEIKSLLQIHYLRIRVLPTLVSVMCFYFCPTGYTSRGHGERGTKNCVTRIRKCAYPKVTALWTSKCMTFGKAAAFRIGVYRQQMKLRKDFCTSNFEGTLGIVLLMRVLDTQTSCLHIWMEV